MAAFGLPVIAVLALWWASTGIILFLDARPARTYRWTLLGSTILLALALVGLERSSAMTTTGAAYEAFSCGLMIWAWQLVTFYTGYVTGPRKTAIGPECTGWPRFVEALRTSIYHELAALLGGVLLFAMTYGRPNQIGFWTYAVLWWMHQSAKLNVFFGVPNLGEEMLPDHLRYLVSFMRRRPMNLFFPVSVTVSTVIAVLLAQKALAQNSTPFEATGFAMLTTMVVLAIAEHWFLVAPLHANALWSWSGKRPPEAPTPLSASAAPRARAPRSADDSDYAAVLSGRGAAVESWSPDPPALCDARRLHHVLESIGTGAYGEVDSVRGILKTQKNWITFELAGQCASVSPFSPQRLQEPLVIAIGRRFDRARLQAAFDACAALT